MMLHQRRCLALVLLLCIACAPGRSAALDDRFQQAVNYIFTGRPDPVDGPQILDRKSCVVLVPEPKFNRYARYYLSRFKMDTARISKKYAGSQTLYDLEVEGDDVIADFNTRGAGQRLRIRARVLAVRAATPDELRRGTLR